MFLKRTLISVGVAVSLLSLPTEAMSYSLSFSGNFTHQIFGLTGVTELDDPIDVAGFVNLDGSPDFTENGHYWPSAESISGAITLDQVPYELNSYSTISDLLVSDSAVFTDSFSLTLEFVSLDGLSQKLVSLTFVSYSDWLMSQEDYPPEFVFF